MSLQRMMGRLPILRSGDAGFSVKLARERSGGEITSENDDISSDKEGEPTPKARPKGVVDGNQVNIPGPGGCDGSRRLSPLIGLGGPLRGSWK
jgi:hypothetical protein